MGDVVGFRSKQKVETGPVPEQPAEGNASQAASPVPSEPAQVASYLVLACPCGATAMELLLGGLIVCTRCHCYSKSNSWQPQAPAVLPPAS